jgi:hypothetical protein
MLNEETCASQPDALQGVFIQEPDIRVALASLGAISTSRIAIEINGLSPSAHHHGQRPDPASRVDMIGQDEGRGRGSHDDSQALE